MTPLDAALACLDAGISVIPIARDGSKQPAMDLLPWALDPDKDTYHRSWNPFREELASREQARKWWSGREPAGVAVVCGNLSGVELIDFDRLAEETFATWTGMVEQEAPDLLPRLCIVETPRQPAGYHVWLRWRDGEIPGNAKLAIDPSSKGKERCLIETRGEGGYALIPGCPGCCHETGREYRFLTGPTLWAMQDVSVQERDLLVRCARALSREVVVDRPPCAPPSGGGLRPGDDFDRRGPDWSELLEPHGWVLAGGHGDERRWRRPGKDRGWSATTGHCRAADGADLLRVFSSNAWPFEDGKAYGKFRALSLLECGGDVKEAARRLGRMGYGERPKAREPTQRPTPEQVEFLLAALEAAPVDRLHRLMSKVASYGR